MENGCGDIFEGSGRDSWLVGESLGKFDSSATPATSEPGCEALTHDRDMCDMGKRVIEL